MSSVLVFLLCDPSVYRLSAGVSFWFFNLPGSFLDGLDLYSRAFTKNLLVFVRVPMGYFILIRWFV
jgi:hypothetical protein